MASRPSKNSMRLRQGSKRGSNPSPPLRTRRERAAVRAELAKAVAEQADLDREFDRAFEAPLRGRELSYVQSPQCATGWQAAGGGSRPCRPAATVGLKRQK